MFIFVLYIFYTTRSTDIFIKLQSKCQTKGSVRKLFNIAESDNKKLYSLLFHICFLTTYNMCKWVQSFSTQPATGAIIPGQVGDACPIS